MIFKYIEPFIANNQAALIITSLKSIHQIETRLMNFEYDVPALIISNQLIIMDGGLIASKIFINMDKDVDPNAIDNIFEPIIRMILKRFYSLAVYTDFLDIPNVNKYPDYVDKIEKQLISLQTKLGFVSDEACILLSY